MHKKVGVARLLRCESKRLSINRVNNCVTTTVNCIKLLYERCEALLFLTRSNVAYQRNFPVPIYLSRAVGRRGQKPDLPVHLCIIPFRVGRRLPPRTDRDPLE